MVQGVYPAHGSEATHTPALHVWPAGHVCGFPQTRQPAPPGPHVWVWFGLEGLHRVCPEGEHSSMHERAQAVPFHVKPVVHA